MVTNFGHRLDDPHHGGELLQALIDSHSLGEKFMKSPSGLLAFKM